MSKGRDRRWVLFSEINHATLRCRVALNVALRRGQRSVTGQFLHVAEGATGCHNILGTARDERAPSAVAGCAVQPKLPFIKPVEPHLYSAGRHSDISLGMNDAVAGLGTVPPRLQSD